MAILKKNLACFFVLLSLLLSLSYHKVLFVLSLSFLLLVLQKYLQIFAELKILFSLLKQYLYCSHAFRGNKLTQKDNADSGVQFITLAGPRQSLLLAKDPNQFL